MKARTILMAAAAVVTAIGLTSLPTFTARAQNNGAVLWGTWYLALDTTPFGIPGGTLPTLASFHRDGTYNLSDGGDFSGAPFGTLNSPQYGSWVAARGGGFEATSLFLEADGATGVVLNITKVHLTLWFDSNDHDSLSGVANVEVVPCAAPGPPPDSMTLNCPNPVTTAGLPGGPPDIPIQLTRLRVGNS